MTARFAGLVVGAMSMAAGEYVSVSSQSDTEQADLARERKELESQPESELAELARVYETRGVESGLAREVAKQMMAKDALAIHARDELGISEVTAARPMQAALTSAATFAVGAALPLVFAVMTPLDWLSWGVSFASLVFLAVLGGIGAKIGGSAIGKGALRVTFWGALALAATAAIGWMFGTSVG